MSTEPRAGRPKASSRETIAEAACELFLEQGYEQTSIADISTRAGVSRSSFFNYFSSKSDVLWAGLDERLVAFEAHLGSDEETDAVAAVRAATLAIAEGFAPDSLALGIVNATAMGLEAEYERDAAFRRARVARAVSTRFVRAGSDPRIHRIMLIDAPAVLGWQRWRELDAANSGRLLQEVLDELQTEGTIGPGLAAPAAHLLSGAMNEAVLWVAQSETPDRDRDSALATLDRLLGSLRQG